MKGREDGWIIESQTEEEILLGQVTDDIFNLNEHIVNEYNNNEIDFETFASDRTDDTDENILYDDNFQCNIGRKKCFELRMSK